MCVYSFPLRLRHKHGLLQSVSPSKIFSTVHYWQIKQRLQQQTTLTSERERETERQRERERGINRGRGREKKGEKEEEKKQKREKYKCIYFLLDLIFSLPYAY
jgi:hypothetical protein